MSAPRGRGRPTFIEPFRKRGIYLLPNLFTTSALFAGFYAIVQGMNHDFERAAIAIFVAAVLDGLDGRVARLTGTQSAFGAEYDSLADMVSFGAAPALVMYEWALRDMGRIGWIAAFIYCVGAALRLARFNTQLSVADKRWFTGLPSPAAGLLVAGMIWVLNDYQVKGGQVKWFAAALTVYAGVTMVSNVRFYSGKDLNLRRAVPFWMTLVIVVALMLISIEPSHVLWGIMVVYGFSGYVLWIVQRVRAEAQEKQYRGIREAIEAGDVTALSRMLVETPPDTRVGEGRTLLMVAVEETNLPAIELMIARGASIDSRDERGLTALGLAAEMGFQEALEVLVAAGADPNIPDQGGLTALDIAEEHGSHDLAAVLLKAGARPGREIAPPAP
ncbi:MAG: CDP-diacylglycerol--serine O-phosphatidyltransferase [Betaproteobacteria bacterium]|nr:CDP-diacylglycerol--serine O-phosphatidyltransferase [Betaproteobacteria bacterium]